jgi:hypothetical protein
MPATPTDGARNHNCVTPAKEVHYELRSNAPYDTGDDARRL